MNEQDRDQLTRLEIRMENLEKGLEQVLTNHLPHLKDAIDKVFKIASCNSGKLWAVGIVLGVILALVIGLYCV